MSTRAKILIAVTMTLIIALFGAALAMLAVYTPTEMTMGQIQKIFYVHLPVAINTFNACLVTFVASVAYLWQRKTKWDDLAASSAKVAVVLCTIVLITGMIWAKGAWGRWWYWSPRLTFSLMLWLLYVVYLIIRNSVDSQQRRAVISAVYAIIAFLDVPLVYLSARLIPDPIHPADIALEPKMQITLMVWFIPVTLAAAGMIALRYMLARAQTAASEAAVSTEAADKKNAIVPGSPMWHSLLTGNSASATTEGK